MPELPDITLYVEHLERRIAGATLTRVRVVGVNLLRTVDPPLESVAGRVVVGVGRIGKRIAIELEGEIFAVIHLMISGRLQWQDAGAAAKRAASGSTAAGPLRLGRNGLALFEFSTGTLTLTEASRHQRAALHVVQGESRARALAAGGIEPLEADPAAYRAALTRENHTLKRALTDPRLFSGIGNAYSDEILHRARLSPLQWTSRLAPEEVDRLREATHVVLREWTDRLRRENGDGFPREVAAFRAGMAVHGRYRKPCPVCGAPVQRIVYAEHETNYCPRCQTGGRLLADRSMSRLLGKDWPKTLEELEEV
jgi:formamidopyrimidine-DNA glycosylase